MRAEAGEDKEIWTGICSMVNLISLINIIQPNQKPQHTHSISIHFLSDFFSLYSHKVNPISNPPFHPYPKSNPIQDPIYVSKSSHP